MKTLSVILLLMFCCGVKAQQADSLRNHVVKEWEKFSMPEENVMKAVLTFRGQVEKYIKSRNENDRIALLENGRLAISQVAMLLKDNPETRLKKGELKKLLNGVDMSAKAIVECDGLGSLVENYYALKFIEEGASVKGAWGSMFFNTSVPTIGNDFDYLRYKRVLESGNPDLMLAYLECLKFVFRYNGYANGLGEIREMVEKNLPESELKTTLMELYKNYYHLREGAPAPSFALKDFKGCEYALEDFRGKVLVIDVWATWCGGCIAKLPKFRELRAKYLDRDDIEFITISIDREGAYNTWKYALPRLKLMEMKNLLAMEEKSDFSKKYNITGIPRYFLIDKEGKIVNVYAPSPGKDFEELINKTLGI